LRQPFLVEGDLVRVESRSPRSVSRKASCWTLVVLGINNLYDPGSDRSDAFAETSTALRQSAGANARDIVIVRAIRRCINDRLPKVRSLLHRSRQRHSRRANGAGCQIRTTDFAPPVTGSDSPARGESGHTPRRRGEPPTQRQASNHRSRQGVGSAEQASPITHGDREFPVLLSWNMPRTYTGAS